MSALSYAYAGLPLERRPKCIIASAWRNSTFPTFCEGQRIHITITEGENILVKALLNMFVYLTNKSQVDDIIVYVQ